MPVDYSGKSLRIPLNRVYEVRLEVGRTVRRVGYPLGLREAEEAIGPERLGAAIQLALKTIDAPAPRRLVEALPDILTTAPDRRPKWVRELVSALCYRYCVERGFGGSQRQIIYEARPNAVGEVFHSHRTRWAKTGDRYPGGRGVDDWDWDPPGLNHMQAVGLLDTWPSCRISGGDYITLALADVTVLSARPSPKAHDQRLIPCGCPGVCRIHRSA